MRLTDLEIRNAKPREKAYKLSDGNNLYLLVTPKGSKLWRFDYRFKGKRKTLSLGSYDLISLKEAREMAFEAKRSLAKGVDPSAVRKASKQDLTFRAIAEKWLESRRPFWNPRHTSTVEGRLRNHLYPTLGNMNITDITPQHIDTILRKLTNAGQVETGRRTLQIASQIFRYSALEGLSQHHDPCSILRGTLPSKRPVHYAAPTDERSAKKILKQVFSYSGHRIVASALKMLAYTFQRPGEVRQMRWVEVDLEKMEWRFEASKTKKPHVVPLSTQAVEVLRQMEPISRPFSPYVFPSPRNFSRPLSNTATNAALKTIGIDTKSELTSHGFRAMARTLLHETLGFQPDPIEVQLAHKGRDSLGDTYNRAKFLEERKRMMQVWADYIDELVTKP